MAGPGRHFPSRTRPARRANLSQGSGGRRGAVAAWQLDGAYTFTLLDNGRASVVSQVGTGSDSAFTDSIPLASGIESIYSLPTDPSQSTLFAVSGDDKSLNVLTKKHVVRLDAGPVHRDSAKTAGGRSWRGADQGAGQQRCRRGRRSVQLQSDRLIGLWQPDGNVIMRPGPPSHPGRRLDRPDRPHDPGRGTGHRDPDRAGARQRRSTQWRLFTITPDTDVLNFLAGQGSLTDAGMLGAAEVGQACWTRTTPAGRRVLPELSSAADPVTGANKVAQAIQHVASLGLGYQPQTSTDVQSASFDLSAGVTTRRPRPRPTRTRQLGQRLRSERQRLVALG